MKHPVGTFDYQVFEILVGTKTPEGYPVTVLRSPAGEGNTHCRLDPTRDLREALAALVAGEVDSAFLTEFGAFLFDELVTGDVAILYRTALGMARSQNARLGVRLRIEAPELAALPWEYMFDASEETFLAIAPETALVRYVPMRLPTRPTTTKSPLRVLVVIANPRDLQPLNVEREKAILCDALAEHLERQQVQLQFVEHATIENINQAMRTFAPHIFHFVGHGLHEGEHAYLVLEDNDEQAHLIDERIFQEFFATAAETRLAILNACQTATTSTVQPLMGLAPRLLQRKLSAVVAMQAPVPDHTALVFVREFYRSLALGYPVDAAISEARKGIFQEIGRQLPDWGFPVLFLRAQDGQLFELETSQPTPLADAPLPPAPACPPTVRNFVGRAEELAYYAAKLAANHLARIAGMAGVGKTALAAQLAVQASSAEKIFWHRCLRAEGVLSVVWAFAAFLANRGTPHVWQTLNTTSKTGTLPPLNVLLDYLFQALQGQDYLICLDDVHHLNIEPAYERLVERLRQAVQAGHVQLIVTAQEVITLGIADGTRALAGLSPADTRQLLATKGVELPEDLLVELHQRTEGNAQLVTLAAQALHQADDHARLIGRLVRAQEIKNFLLSLVDAGLTDTERAVMQGVAALLGWPGTADAIEEVLESQNARRTLAFLSNRYLLEEFDGIKHIEYGEHATVQSFYYEMLGRRQRIEMHRRAACYYEQAEHDTFKAALHYLHAQENATAAGLAMTNMYQQICMGRSAALLRLFDEIRQTQVAAEVWAEIWIAKGDIYCFLQQFQTAQTAYQTAQVFLAHLPLSAAVRRLQIRLHRGLGYAYKDADPVAALRWLQCGRELFDQSVHRQEEAELLVYLGDVQARLGDVGTAIRTLEQSLRLVPPGPTRVRLLALINLGVCYYYQADLPQCGAYFEQALQMAGQLQDPFNRLSVLVNLASLQQTTGEWTAAVETYQLAAELAAHLGDLQEQTTIDLNCGVLCLHQGNALQAEQKLRKAIEQARKMQNHEVILLGLTHLSELYLGEEDLAAAQWALAEVEQAANMSQVAYVTPFIAYMRARYSLAVADYDQARRAAELAIEAASQQKMSQEEGQGWRVLGQTQMAQHQYQQALISFERSLGLVAANPYESARTRLVWGQCLLAMNETTQGQHLVQEAQVGLQALHVPYDQQP